MKEHTQRHKPQPQNDKHTRSNSLSIAAQATQSKITGFNVTLFLHRKQEKEIVKMLLKIALFVLLTVQQISKSILFGSDRSSNSGQPFDHWRKSFSFLGYLYRVRLQQILEMNYKILKNLKSS